MEIRKILDKYPPERDNMLNILHELQDSNPRNYLSEEAVRAVAKHLNTTLAEVYGVVKYYTMFSTTPRGKHIIRLCQSPICHLMGSGTILEELQRLLGTGLNEPTADGLFSLELSECLGICDVAPAMMIGDEIFGPLTPDYAGKILETIRQKEHLNYPGKGNGQVQDPEL